MSYVFLSPTKIYVTFKNDRKSACSSHTIKTQKLQKTKKIYLRKLNFFKITRVPTSAYNFTNLYIKPGFFILLFFFCIYFKKIPFDELVVLLFKIPDFNIIGRLYWFAFHIKRTILL